MSEFEHLERVAENEWLLHPHSGMRVPGVLFADEATIEQLHREASDQADWSALRQLRQVASLPGIVAPAVALPDVHPGYGFPIGGVGAFDLEQGVVVVGGVGFDINCGVRLLRTPLHRADLAPDLERLGEDLFRTVPAGLGATGALQLTMDEIDRLLVDGARFVFERGLGIESDLDYIEEGGRMEDADPAVVSRLAKQRQFEQVGTLGSGNHYLEIQSVEEVLDPSAAVYGLEKDQVVIAIHTGSRALGHQIGQDYLKRLADAPRKYGFEVSDRELVCAPIRSPEGAQYLQAMRCGANCAFANRQAIAHLVRRAFVRCCGLQEQGVETVYDIGHNSAKVEHHEVSGKSVPLLVHRKGATRAFGPGHPAAPAAYRTVGHPILVGGTMGTSSYILHGTEEGMRKAFGSGVHGAGRALSRKKATKRFWSEEVEAQLAAAGIRLWTHNRRGISEEAPAAYKDVDRVVATAASAGLNVPVARLRPMGVIKG
jgi:tRNA-splicing ligase RtcB